MYGPDTFPQRAIARRAHLQQLSCQGRGCLLNFGGEREGASGVGYWHFFPTSWAIRVTQSVSLAASIQAFVKSWGVANPWLL